MTPLQRVEAVLERRIPDRVPVCLHNFLLATREAGVTMEQYRNDPHAIAKVHLEALEKYQYDCLCIDLDTTMLAEAMGAGSQCAPDEPGRIVRPAIDRLEDATALRKLDPYSDGRVPVLLEAIRLMARELNGRVSIRGNCDQGPFSLAALVRGLEDFLMDLLERPDDPAIQQLLDVCYESHLATHRAVMQAGAHFTSLGESLSGPDVVSPKIFQQFARPFQQRLVSQLRAEDIFTVIHICGDTTPILDQLSQYDFCGFELDYKTSTVEAKRTAGADHVLLGNIDPSGTLAQGTSEEVDRATCELIGVWKPAGLFILNAGCAIPATTPADNIHSFVASARKYGVYE